MSGFGPRAYEAGLVGIDDGLDPVAQPELGQYPPEMRLHRGFGDAQPFGDLKNNPGPDAFGPWTGFLILCGYTALILAISAVLLVRRDA